MRTLWIGIALGFASPLALAQSTIYKHIDESGRVTYSNRPMKGATVLDLEPLSQVPPVARPVISTGKPAVAVVTPRSLATNVASIDRDTQKGRDDVRKKILQDELAQEESSLSAVRKSLLQEQQNPTLIAAVRVAQQAADPTPAQQAEMRASIDRASGRIRGLQATVAEHEKNIEALKKELGALKP